MRKQLAAGSGVTIGATLAMGGVAQAACTCNVDSLADPTDTGHITLRDAITSANANPGSTVTFASSLSGTITLNGTQLPQMTAATTIAGPGPSQLTVSGNNASRVFYVRPAAGVPVAISGLTITGGNTAGAGAGIHSKYAPLTVSNVVITGNHVTGSGGNGGAIDVQGTGSSLTITTSTISGNTASVWGGGVYTRNGVGATAIISSTISGNQAGAAGGMGGGAYLAFNAPATVENSTIYGNSAGSNGGGLYHYGAPTGQGLTVTGSTITHNTANRGGGIASAGNPFNAQPVLHNAIVFSNTAATGPDLSAFGGSMSAAFSLIGSVDPATTINQTIPGSDIAGDPQLGPLSANGGPTQTQKPAPSSPVVDKGAAFGLTADQRGSGRPFEIPTIPNSSAAGADGSDIGAVELQPSDLPSNAFTLGKVKGKKLPVNVTVPGSVSVSDAGAPLSAVDAKKKKRKLFLNTSTAAGGPPTITVALRLTKLGKQQLRRKGKLTANARVRFTPNFGIAKTVTAKLKIKAKHKK